MPNVSAGARDSVANRKDQRTSPESHDGVEIHPTRPSFDRRVQVVHVTESAFTITICQCPCEASSPHSCPTPATSIDANPCATTTLVERATSCRSSRRMPTRPRFSRTRVTAPTQVRPSRRILSSRAACTGTCRRPTALLIAFCRSCEAAPCDSAAHTPRAWPLPISPRTTRTAVRGDSRGTFWLAQPASANSTGIPTATARIRSLTQGALHRSIRPEAARPAAAAGSSGSA